MTETVESSETGLTIEDGRREADLKRVEPTSHAGETPEKAGFEKRLGEMIEKEVSRRFQSAKDKRWAQLEKQYGDLSELREIAGSLLTSSEAGQEIRPQHDPDLETRIRSLADLPGVRENEDARALILRNLGDPDLLTYVRVMEALIQITLGTIQGERVRGPVSAATAMTPGGSDAPGDLAEAYQRRKHQLRPGDVNGLTALKREFRQKGLDVF